MDEYDDKTQKLIDNLRYIQSLNERFGQRNAADLVILADRLVKRGFYYSRKEAIDAIIEQNPDV